MDTTWAACTVAACFAATAAIAFGAWLALSRAPGEMSSFEACGAWLAGLYYPMLASFSWTAIEGLREWSRARRRLQIGLGDPVVANRFLLWGLVGAFSATNALLGIYLNELGLAATKDPVAASISTAGGIVCAALLWLTFMPPAAYLRWIRVHEAPA